MGGGMSPQELMVVVETIATTPTLRSEIREIVAEISHELVHMLAEHGHELTAEESKLLWTEILSPAPKRRRLRRTTLEVDRERSLRNVRRYKLSSVLREVVESPAEERV